MHLRSFVDFKGRLTAEHAALWPTDGGDGACEDQPTVRIMCSSAMFLLAKCDIVNSYVIRLAWHRKESNNYGISQLFRTPHVHSTKFNS